MKFHTALSCLSVAAALSLPTAAIAQFTGFVAPTAWSVSLVFGAFVAALMLIIAFADYGRVRFPQSARNNQEAVPLLGAKATHPLAA